MESSQSAEICISLPTAYCLPPTINQWQKHKY